MTPQKLVFATAVEALFVRELGGHLTGVARRMLREVGLDLEQPLEVTYSLEQWKRFVSTAATVLYPHLSSAEAHWWMGIHFVEGSLQTSTGRLVAEMAPVLGPRRMLERMSADLSQGNNFSEVRLVELKPGCVELWMNDVLDDHSSFAAGFIKRTQQMVGARNVSVDVWSFDGTAGTYLVRWRDAVRG